MSKNLIKTDSADTTTDSADTTTDSNTTLAPEDHTEAVNEKSRLSLLDRKRLVVDFIQGIPKHALAKKYNVSPSTVSIITAPDSPDHARSQAQAEMRAAHIAFENASIRQLKEIIFSNSANALQSFFDDTSDSRFVHYIDNINKFLSNIDKMERLNDDRATSISKTDTTTKSLDVVELMKELKTPDKAKEYLLNTLHRHQEENHPSVQ